MEGPHVGSGKRLKISRDFKRRSSIHCGSSFWRADLAHDVGRDAGVEALESLLAIGEVVEAAVDVRDLGAVLGHCVPLYACCSAAADGGAWARCSAASALEGLKAVLVDPGDERGVVLAHDVTL